MKSNLTYTYHVFGKGTFFTIIMCVSLCQLGGLWRSPVHRDHVCAGGGRIPQHCGHGLPVLRVYPPLHTHHWTCEYGVWVSIEKKMYIWVWEYQGFKLSLLSLSRSCLCPPSPCSVRLAVGVAGWCWPMELWICCRQAWTHTYVPWWWREECMSPFSNFHKYIFGIFKGAISKCLLSLHCHCMNRCLLQPLILLRRQEDKILPNKFSYWPISVCSSWAETTQVLKSSPAAKTDSVHLKHRVSEH